MTWFQETRHVTKHKCVRKQNNMSLNTLHVMNRDITSQNTIKHNKITPIKSIYAQKSLLSCC